MRFWKHAVADQEGFTLLELLIVVVVLGVLAGIVTFAVGGVRDEAARSACAADARTLATANAAYSLDHGSDAPNAQELEKLGYLGSVPVSGVTFQAGVIDTSGCGAPPQLAFTSDDETAPTQDVLLIDVPVPSKHNSTKGKVEFSGAGAIGAQPVTVFVHEGAACSGTAKHSLTAGSSDAGSWGPTSERVLDDGETWSAKASQGDRSSSCVAWDIPEYD